MTSFPSEVSVLILSYSVGSEHLRKMARFIDRDIIILSSKIFLGRKKDISYKDALYIFQEYQLTLPYACFEGNLPVVEYFLENLPGEHHIHPPGDVLLTCNCATGVCGAVEQGHRKILQCFYNRGWKFTDEDVLTAVREGKLETVRWLLEHGVDPDVVKTPEAVFRAIHGRDNLSMLKWLIKQGADVRAQNDMALVEACGTGKLEIARFLLKIGANVNTLRSISLLQACYGEHREIVKLLLKYGVDLNIRKEEITRVSIMYGMDDIILKGIR